MNTLSSFSLRSVRNFFDKHTPMTYLSMICIPFLSLALFAIGCSSSQRFTSSRYGSMGAIAVSKSGSANTRASKSEIPPPVGQVIRGYASYYGDEFDGRLTSNGEVFNQKMFTAAHRSLPFGTRIRVTNLRNNRSCFVRVNDRGPFVEGREVDLSKAAAEQLDMTREGVAQVVITVID